MRHLKYLLLHFHAGIPDYFYPALNFEWFYKVMFCSLLHGKGFIGFRIRGGKDDYSYMLPTLCNFNSLQCFFAVHTRHINVEKNKIGQVLIIFEATYQFSTIC